MPSRIRRRRAKGWRMPAGAIDCGPGTPWANPFVRDRRGDTAADLKRLYEICLGGYLCVSRKVGFEPQKACRAHIIAHREALRGHDLACTCRLCPDHTAGLPLGVRCERCAPCHVDVLIEVANG